jgi:glycosyltransferase involved in cell wall biosynthesis
VADASGSGANGDITVVIPCFDYGRFVHEAVSSALEQQGGPPRVIVVDDGSTDAATLEALDRLPPGVDLIRQQNQGPAAARNAALERTETALIVPLDADDRLAPGALQTLRPVLEQRPELGYSYGYARFFGAWEGELRLPAFDPYRLLHRALVPITALIRREVFDAVGGYDRDFAGYEDWDFSLSALEHGWRGELVPAVTLEYRRHKETIGDPVRRNYRHWYRLLRRKHARLFARRAEFARETDLGPGGRLAYRLFWAKRPIPGWIEQRLYSLFFRR